MLFESEVFDMKKQVEELKTLNFEQLHYVKMKARRWLILFIVSTIILVISNLIWLFVWNQYEYEEEIISEDVITTITQDGENNSMSGVDINGETNYNY